MIGNDDFIDALRGSVAQDGTITPLRLSLFLIGLLAALLWGRGRPVFAVLIASMGTLGGLGYWLVQIRTPFGLTTDPVVARGWAQAGVNTISEPARSGFVFETDPEVSLVSGLASLGLPFRLVVLTPQVTALLTVAFLALLPFAFLRNKTSAAFAATLAAGGGLWPGLTPYASILARPTTLLAALALSGILLAFSRNRVARKTGKRFGLVAFLGAIGVAALDRALRGGLEPAAASAFFLTAASLGLSSPLRATLRASSPSQASARRREAMLLLCAISGSGVLWWDPPRSVVGFREACNPNLAFQGAPMEWIRNNVPKDKVVLASPVYSATIAAFTGRRVLFSPAATEAQGRVALAEQPRREHLLDSARLGQPVAKMAESFSVTHFFLGPGEPTPLADPVLAPDDGPAMKLVLMYQDREDFRIYRLDKK